MTGAGDGATLEAIGAAVVLAAPAGPYVVLRHPGRAPGAWRVVASRESAEAAKVVLSSGRVLPVCGVGGKIARSGRIKTLD